VTRDDDPAEQTGLPPAEPEASAPEHVRAGKLRALHLRIGFWGLAAFALLGLLLETFHAYKAPFYVDVDVETRRMMWRLAHAHGALLCVLNVVFALSAPWLHCSRPERRALASRALISATLLLPAGFLLGGAGAENGDPGLGIALVPAGALLLLAALVRSARGVER
jgi:hypothetical protein